MPVQIFPDRNDEKQTILKWCDQVSLSMTENLFIQKLRIGGLSDSMIVSVINALETTCHHCWDSEKGCQCWNDE